MARRSQDSYGRRAKAEGQLARSVYKLEEIDRRIGLFKRGQRVLDLGASPGSWSQYAAEKVGPKGHVLAVDKKPIQLSTDLKHLSLVEADIFTLDNNVIERHAPYDIVMSDMAPSTSGQRHADQFHSFELFAIALKIATLQLRPKGSFVGKIFQGPEFDEARELVRQNFISHRLIRPKATRRESYELFIVAQKLKMGQATDSSANQT